MGLKRQNREVVIFSMSVVDLFASALGAFILIAVILLPYFPNTGDSTQRVEEVQKELDAAQAAQKAAQSELEGIKKENERLKEKPKPVPIVQPVKPKLPLKIQFPQTDIVIAMDTTSSMKGSVDGMKREIQLLAKLLDRMAPSASIGVVDFKDRCEKSTIRYFAPVIVNSVSTGRLQAFVDTMRAGSASCNHDGPEAVGAALGTAMRFNWRQSSKVRIIIIVTDNPAYPEEVSQTFNMARAFAQQGGKVSTVFAQGGSRSAGREYLSKLARAGNGQAVKGGGSFVGTVLLAMTD